MASTTYTPTDCFSVVEAEEIESGTLALTLQHSEPVLFCTNVGRRMAILFAEPGNAFQIFDPLTMRGLALACESFTLEVDLSSRLPFVHDMGSVGNAFIGTRGSGIVGVWPSGPNHIIVPFLLDGTRADFTDGDRNVAFARWRLVTGAGEQRVTLFGYDAGAGGAPAA